MLDIKLPIGLLFSIMGVILTIYGIVTKSDTAMYEKSLNININLWSGLIMLVFGIAMLILSKLKKKI
ncbi:MAG: hypothetical protein IPH57_15425 [Saprospiraceae bacterium]|nr:hypothetical protein [Saprospiraceae bacterium]